MMIRNTPFQNLDITLTEKKPISDDIYFLPEESILIVSTTYPNRVMVSFYFQNANGNEIKEHYQFTGSIELNRKKHAYFKIEAQAQLNPLPLDFKVSFSK